ncbi:MAG: glycosyltransferase family 2 protein [Candidatus Eremiobacteraeota bacterium]|nr:glycosyltransferase family 2 protein [Candidatus Eremiobacteraeota bacterium]
MDSSKERGATYVLPLRASATDSLPELAAYLNGLNLDDVIVVDSSAPHAFSFLNALVDARVRHVRPDERITGTNGKVRNVLSALPVARHERIVVADDDVRYDDAALTAVIARLDSCDVVRPQNYFSPLPWHAWLDTGRTLVNRALDGDWPGTLAFKRSKLPYGYNANALFENYELVRTIRARGGRECVARDIFVVRRPPTTEHFFTQRVRQAYDEFARPWRLLVALAILPAVVAAWALHMWFAIAAFFCGALALGAFGRQRANGARYFPVSAILATPLWFIERACCAWFALYERVRYGGVRYAGGIVRDAVSSPAELQRQWAR